MAQVIIISGASGSGKTSLIKAVLPNISQLALSISHTTRAIRPNEVDGVDYHFCNKSAFDKAIANQDFLEYAQVFDNSYGTQKSNIVKQLASGLDVIVELDWQGAQQVRQQFPEAISIAIMPSSLAQLETRLTSRGQDNQIIIDRRMQDAMLEMSHYDEYDYIIINEDFNQAQNELNAIITTQRLSLNAQKQKIQILLKQP